MFGGPDVAGSGATWGSALDGSATHSTLESHGDMGRSRALGTIGTRSALCMEMNVCGGMFDEGRWLMGWMDGL